MVQNSSNMAAWGAVSSPPPWHHEHGHVLLATLLVYYPRVSTNPPKIHGNEKGVDFINPSLILLRGLNKPIISVTGNRPSRVPVGEAQPRYIGWLRLVFKLPEGRQFILLNLQKVNQMLIFLPYYTRVTVCFLFR